MSDYAAFLQSKKRRFGETGFDCDDQLPSFLFPWQRQIVKWAVKKGRAALWADTGLGKTAMQLAWADQVQRRTGKPVLILTPLAVSYQTVKEAEKFGLHASIAHDQTGVVPLTVTNYHKLHKFDASVFGGVVLDESSILKSFQGKTKTLLTETFAQTPYRLACTATPAPNDHLELGNHSDFLGIMPQKEMLARWFLNDLMGNMTWRLKGHAKQAFWRWVASWALVLRKPSDLGYDDTGYNLPPLNIQHVTIPTTGIQIDGALFADASLSATTLHEVMRQTAPIRARKAAELVGMSSESCLLWTHTNYEADEILRLIGHLPNVLEVRGSDSDDKKELASLWFTGQACICRRERAWRKKDITRSTTRRIETREFGNHSTINGITEHGAAHTCAITSSVTEKESLNCEGPMQTSGTRDDENDIRQMRECGNGTGSTLGNGRRKTQRGDSRNALSPTESLQKSTGDVSIGKVGGAQFASQENINGCTLTTAISQELSEDSSVHHATLDSENSKTTQIVSSVPSCTCGYLSGSRILLSKPSIFGYGLNFQNCHSVLFVGMDYSYESFYQAVRRCYRFGQTKPVTVYCLATDMEWRLFDALAKKQAAHEDMQNEMLALMKEDTCLTFA